jgi:hypothetical protein
VIAVTINAAGMEGLPLHRNAPLRDNDGAI